MRLRRARALSALALALAGLAACGAPDRGEAGDDAANGADATNRAATPAGAPEPPVAEAQALDRLGAIRIGATLDELAREGAIVEGRDEPLSEDATCGYARFRGLPEVAAMLDGDRVVRIDVWTARHATLGGVRVGQGEAEALRRLGGRAKVEPHPYTGPDGHYLVVHEAGAPRGLILETDGATVQSWRIGRWEEVQWIEGCA